VTLIYLALAILSFAGAGAIITWVRRGEEHVTFGVVAFVLALGFMGLLFTGIALDSL
jgi:hypothetical protein